MRISDWSSDVCSSDLARRRTSDDEDIAALDDGHGQDTRRVRRHDAVGHIVEQRVDPGGGLADREARCQRHGRQHAFETLAGALAMRSEEHTSELQSLMRISYAVYCLTKKTKTNKYDTQ